jgi:hypothetical protein
VPQALLNLKPSAHQDTMADMQKKMAAALAAVNGYLMMEEQMAADASRQLQESQAPFHTHSPWSQCGRQDMMTMRRLMQLRTFTSLR